jgi:hypothetical protein
MQNGSVLRDGLTNWLAGHQVHPTGPAGAFTVSGNWIGGHYELLIELDGGAAGETLTALGVTLGVRGWFTDQEREPEDQKPVRGTPEAVRQHGKLFGRVRLPSGVTVVCMVVLIELDDSPDLLDFIIPLGALAASGIDAGGFPFGPDGDERSLAWRRPLDDWLAAVAIEIYAATPFRHALIGFEATDIDDSELGGPDLDGPPLVGRIVVVDGSPVYRPAGA